MKIPVTDQFLWDLYKHLQSAGKVADFVLSTSYHKAKILRGGQNPVFEKYRQMRSVRKFSWLINYLKQHNYIKVQNLRGREAILLTQEGIAKALKADFKVDPQPKRKDGKWIMVMFDIPQKHPKARVLLRGVLKNLGYKMYQQSVWVTPYNISEKTERLLQHYNLDEYVKIFLIKEL